MLRISFAAEFQRFALTLDDFGRKQLPYAAKNALNESAYIAQANIQRRMPLALDRPTPFSVRQGIAVVAASKSKLEAAVLVKDRQTEYLALQELGGINQPKKKALVAPALIRLNQYGNIRNKGIKALHARDDVFFGKVRTKRGLVGGVWQRPKPGKEGQLKLLARFDDAKQVKPHPFFFPGVEEMIRRDFDRLLGQAIEHAMRTARP